MPTISSGTPAEYTSAVATKPMPASRARWTICSATVWAWTGRLGATGGGHAVVRSRRLDLSEDGLGRDNGTGGGRDPGRRTTGVPRCGECRSAGGIACAVIRSPAPLQTAPDHGHRGPGRSAPQGEDTRPPRQLAVGAARVPRSPARSPGSRTPRRWRGPAPGRERLRRGRLPSAGGPHRREAGGGRRRATRGDRHALRVRGQTPESPHATGARADLAGHSDSPMGSRPDSAPLPPVTRHGHPAPRVTSGSDALTVPGRSVGRAPAAAGRAGSVG